MGIAMAPMMKASMKSTVMTKSALCAAIAEACEIKSKVASTALATLAAVGAGEVKKSGKFVVPGLAMIKTRKKPATKAGKKLMFGEMKLVKAKREDCGEGVRCQGSEGSVLSG